MALGWLVGKPDKALESAEFFGEEGMIRTEETLMAQSVRRMKAECHQKGLERGWREGFRRGFQEGLSLAQLRHMLLSQAKLKFGAETAAELVPVLDCLFERQHIEIVAEAIVECSGAGEFIRRAREA